MRQCNLLFLWLSLGWPRSAAVRDEIERKKTVEPEAVGCVDANDVSISSKTKKGLQRLPGIGKSLAGKIAEGRPWTSPTLQQLIEEQVPPVLTVEVKKDGDSGVLMCPRDAQDATLSKALPKSRTIDEGCLDANIAELADLLRLDWNKKLAGLVLEIRAEASCFKNLKHMESAIKEKTRESHDYWTETIEFTVELGLLCVPETPCDPNPIRGAAPKAKEYRHEGKRATTSFGACGHALPPVRDVQMVPRDFTPELRFVTLTQGQGWGFHDGTKEDKSRCMDAFPDGRATVSSAAQDSFGVCIFYQAEGEQREILEYSEYNTRRKIPNFVAFRVFDTLASDDDASSAQCHDQWRQVCPASNTQSCGGLVDEPFGPSAVTSEKCRFSDNACGREVGTRGHMSAVGFHNWNAMRCKATMSYLNAFPSRTSFDAFQWATREHAVMSYLKATRSKEREKQGMAFSLWMVVGVSTESDGFIESQRSVGGGDASHVEVPSFAWTALYDPFAKKATGWMCRNGLTEGDECYCVDKLSIHELERHVGFPIFPHLKGERDLDLDDGLLKEFWAFI